MILITGGAGFIGSNLAHTLVKEYKIRIFDNLVTGNLRNLSQIRKRIEFVKGDIRNLKEIKEAVKDVEYVLHEAALPSVTRSIKDPITTHEINAKGTLNLLIAARDAEVKRVIYASSSSIYGASSKLPKKENLKPNPISPYGISKLVGEEYCKIFNKLYGLETISLRYFNVFGPRQNLMGEYAAVIPKFISLLLQNKAPTIFGDGLQTRDFIYIKDVVHANILAMNSKRGIGEVFNIAQGKSTSINELVNILNELLGKNIKPIYSSPRIGDIKHSVADILKAQEVLNYQPTYSSREGLKETIEFFKQV